MIFKINRYMKQINVLTQIATKDYGSSYTPKDIQLPLEKRKERRERRELLNRYYESKSFFNSKVNSVQVVSQRKAMCNKRNPQAGYSRNETFYIYILVASKNGIKNHATSQNIEQILARMRRVAHSPSSLEYFRKY